jgi:hypothetical protein
MPAPEGLFDAVPVLSALLALQEGGQSTIGSPAGDGELERALADSAREAEDQMMRESQRSALECVWWRP